jgi:hypothetical protein
VADLTDIERIAGRELAKGREYAGWSERYFDSTKRDIEMVMERSDAALAERDAVIRELGAMLDSLAAVLEARRIDHSRDPHPEWSRGVNWMLDVVLATLADLRVREEGR